jgi:hypothetical protein
LRIADYFNVEEGSETLVLLEHLQPCSTVFRLRSILDTKSHHIHAVARRRKIIIIIIIFKMLLIAPKYETMLLINLEAPLYKVVTKGCYLMAKEEDLLWKLKYFTMQKNYT